jgi:hypothetical protein
MKCPGQDPRFWKFDAIFEAQCPNCGSSLEFFKDETRRKCKNCGHQVLNPKMDFGCAAHCKFAEHCFGELPPELIKQKKDMLKDRLALEMKMYFKSDFKSISRAIKIARYVEKIAGAEKADPPIAITAAYLREMVQKEARTGDDDDAKALPRRILEKLDAAPGLIEEVCNLIETKEIDKGASSNSKVLHDAGILADLEQEIKSEQIDQSDLTEIIRTQFITNSARELAREVLVEQGA